MAAAADLPGAGSDENLVPGPQPPLQELEQSEHVQGGAKLDFFDRYKLSGGAEIANSQSFVKDLCTELGLPHPDPTNEANYLNDYVFERRVDFKSGGEVVKLGRIDCYKRDCFILEAKQSAKRLKIDAKQIEIFGEDAAQRKLGHAKRGTKSWDRIMRSARKQAEDYARALPVEHGYPPFLLIVDVGNVIEVFADFSGQGKNYAHFPDRKSFRITMDDLRTKEVQERLRKIWTTPEILNPALISARVTRDIADRLAKIAKMLEGKHEPKAVAEFLMRCLFTMFAEDVELIPRKSFENLLEELKSSPQSFVPMIESLWKDMDAGSFSTALRSDLRRFNGSLFADARALPLDADGIHELWVAARRDWQEVEPAIFGTLLEHALDPRERSKLGAHYTPRAYVERLVVPTIIEPLRENWEVVEARAHELVEAGDKGGALAVVRTFHHTLCTTRVLDPACGTGNFLYVSLELMKRLEGEVLEAMDELGLMDPKLALETETVSPRQFFGLEINPRAVPIAELVLWIGFLKWQLKTAGVEAITEPVLHKYDTIRQQDAILAYDGKSLAREADGKPVSRWDGFTTRTNHIGVEVPDPAARVEAFDYENPRAAQWPEAEFIVGNPPFIGGKDMRAELGDGYAEAAWKARPKVPGGADFVMHFWDEAAKRLARKPTKAKPNPLRRFGFITTNSLTQTFSRRVVEAALSAKSPIKLVYAVPDHPWMKGSDRAAVRIAMTVAERGDGEGVLATVVREAKLNTDTPEVELFTEIGAITPKLNTGADTSGLESLLSNSLMSHKGYMPYGAAFFIGAATAKNLGLGKVDNANCFIKPYLNGRQLNGRLEHRFTIDFHDKSEDFVRSEFPAAYQYLRDNVRPDRQENNIAYRRHYWWRFGQPSTKMRSSLSDIDTQLVSSLTTKHLFWQELPTTTMVDQTAVVVSLDDTSKQSVLSSKLHSVFAMHQSSRMGVGNDIRYNKTNCFDPFPFPACVTDNSSPALRERLRKLGERLDAHRKRAMEQHDHLTMTGIYNVLERVREGNAGIGESLSESEKDVYDAALIGVLAEIHDEIDKAVLDAYGWGDLAEALVGKVGGTLPSPHKSPEQEAAEEELLVRLVALNRERREEERRGHVRWLRPDYQIPKLDHKVRTETDDMELEVAAIKDAPTWPKDGLAQIKSVRDILALADAPLAPDIVSAAFKARNTAKRKARVAEVLSVLEDMGQVRSLEESDKFFAVL